ncbi:hypothetical protein IWW34DRAFT_802508 [Fusarium oxysporum f. sp. albedinis]|nr:hypothetical protein IWW34DRAFT_802508 [Fusarium oxysporum f. sp. albedinis]KAJ0150344.1 Highly reducing polyketide synthase alt5 [Fusarium oxysporum f. sp. albedinis]KAK2477346.1 hypothetical protein H9L39_09834 [Fusarium oxysporum f. sp. albedinis]
MRSVVALAALALSGSLDLAAASLCKPRPSHLSSATTDLTPSDTATSAAASETAESVVIKSVVDGGGFSVAPPEGGVPGFTVDGDATIVVGPGYKGDGSKDSGCLSLQASGDKKRDLGSFAGVAQSLDQLSLTRPYTVRFFYLVVTAPSLNFCQLTASLGSQTFFQTWIISFGTNVQWGMALEQVTAAQRSAPLSISMNCLVGGSAQVYVDSLFMSNQVTPATINDHPLDLGDSDASIFTTTSSSAIQTTTSSKVGTTSVPPIIPTHAESSDASSNSATPGTGSPNTQPTGNHTPVTDSPHTVPTGNNTPGSVDSQTSAAGNTQATTQPGPQTPGAQTPGARTTTSDTEKQTSTESAATSASTSSGSSSPRQSSTIKPDGPVSRVCANVGTSSIAGRGCGMQPYNSAGAYSRFTSSNYQKEDCAALCLADENCKSFEWSYGNNCANECRLIASVLSDVPVGNTGTQFTSYDRSCIISKPCPSFPEDSICINKMGSTPNKGCVRRKGTLKSCAQEFATLTVQPCGDGDQCRDMCAMYADCQSYSYTSLLSQRNCKLYAGTTDEITDEGGSDYFSDIGCWACGQNMGFSTYGLLTNDNVVLPEMTCQAPTKAVADTPTTFNTRTTQAAESTSSSAAVQQPPTTTTESASSTATVMTCPTGIAAPGFCQPLDSLPTQSVSLPGIMDHWPQSDGDIEPPVQRTCNAFGVKKGGWWGRTVQSNRRQNTMEDCALLCREEGYCEAFGLDTTSGWGNQCALSTYKLGTEGIDLNVPYFFWWSDLDCYECHDCQAA